VLIVSVYVVDEDDETAWLRRQRPGRDEAVFGVDAVDPDYRVACVYLSMEWPTAGIANKSTSFESEDIDKEALGCFHVLIDSQRNDGLGSHARDSFLDLSRTQFRGVIYFWLIT